MNKTGTRKKRESKSREAKIMELKRAHPGEWILILKDGSNVHAQKLSDVYALVPHASQIRATLRPYKPQELLLY